MMGLGGVVTDTPISTGRLRVAFSGTIGGGTTTSCGVLMTYGTGTAPANGAAQTGTVATAAYGVNATNA